MCIVILMKIYMDLNTLTHLVNHLYLSRCTNTTKEHLWGFEKIPKFYVDNMRNSFGLKEKIENKKGKVFDPHVCIVS